MRHKFHSGKFLEWRIPGTNLFFRLHEFSLKFQFKKWCVTVTCFLVILTCIVQPDLFRECKCHHYANNAKIEALVFSFSRHLNMYLECRVDFWLTWFFLLHHLWSFLVDLFHHKFLVISNVHFHCFWSALGQTGVDLTEFSGQPLVKLFLFCVSCDGPARVPSWRGWCFYCVIIELFCGI